MYIWIIMKVYINNGFILIVNMLDLRVITIKFDPSKYRRKRNVDAKNCRQNRAVKK